MKIVLLIFLVFSFAVLPVFAVPLESLISPAQIQQLKALEQGRIFETQLRNPAPVLMPVNSGLQQVVNEARTTLNPNTMVEALYLYKKPLPFHTSSEIWDAGQKSGLFNQLLAISSLTGIEYFSASRNAMRTFYEFSGVIDGPQTKRPVPDPFYSSPQALTLFARQKDLTFGDNIYRYDYGVTSDTIFFIQENVTALSIGIIPVIGKGNLRSVMAVMDCGDSILVYAVSMAKAVSLPGMGDRISSSLGNRADALLYWFSGRLSRELFN